MSFFGAGLALILLAGLSAFLLEGHGRLAGGVFATGLVGGGVLAAWPALGLLGTMDSSLSVAGGAFGMDLLSAWFLVLLLVVGMATGIYGVPYLAKAHPHRGAGRIHLVFTILLVSVAGVFAARTVGTFLASWEVMAISAYLLIMVDHDQAPVRRAGFIYLVLTHTSTLALVAMFAAWTGGEAGGGGWTAPFDHLAGASDGPLFPMTLILLLALGGFGIKAGIVPVHFWLPGAHAAAPSHVSAFLSGVMIKSGIYGLLRVLMLLHPVPPPAWWGWTLLALGLGSAVLGVLWALAQHDIKRLLAYHSVENIGIILLGLGVGALGVAYHQPALALLGVAGALVHTLNHALFKSLLFLGAGAVVLAAGTRQIDRLGGFARAMPLTASAFLVGSLAIVGLPPLNGFVSEWMIFRGLLETGTLPGAVRIASLAVVGLALTGALALACFTKLYGTVFHGMPRSGAPGMARGVDAGLIWPQWALATACIGVGVLPFVVVPVAAGAAGAVLGGTVTRSVGGIDRVAEGSTAVAGAALGLVLVLALIGWIRWRRGSRKAARVGDTWACAYPRVTSRMQYGASSYAAGLMAAFGPMTGSRVVSHAGSFHVQVADPVLDTVGLPVWERVSQAAARLRFLQTGRLRWYLIYLILSLVALLLYLWSVTTTQ